MTRAVLARNRGLLALGGRRFRVPLLYAKVYSRVPLGRLLAVEDGLAFRGALTLRANTQQPVRISSRAPPSAVLHCFSLIPLAGLHSK